MRAMALTALLIAAALVQLHQVQCQDPASQGAAAAAAGRAPGLLDQLPPAPEGLPTGGTKARDVLDKLPPFTGPVRQAVVVPAPSRFGRLARQAAAAAAAARQQPAAADPVAAQAGVAAPAAADVVAAAAAGVTADVAAAAAAGAVAGPELTPEAAAADGARQWKAGAPLFRTVEEAEAQDTPAAAAAAQGAVTIAAISSLYQPIFDKHNYYRSWHNTPALTWSDTLASNAAGYAAGCVWGHSSNLNGQGENLWAMSGTNNQAQMLMYAIDQWYAEYSLYDYNYPGFSGDTGHFTQVVWYSTAQVGCAVQQCGSGFAGWSNGGTYVVCRYYQGGNVNSAEYFRANVLPRNANPPPTTPPPPSPPPPSPKPPPPPSPKPPPPPSPKPPPPPSPRPPPPPSPRPPPPPSPKPAPPPPPPPPAVIPPGTLPQGYMITTTASGGPGCLVSQSRYYWICIYSDSNMVLFKNGVAIWSTNTAGRSRNAPIKLVMMTDGNLNIYDNGNVLQWTTNTARRGTAPRRFIMQNDGNALIADANNQATWASYTAGL